MFAGFFVWCRPQQLHRGIQTSSEENSKAQSTPDGGEIQIQFHMTRQKFGKAKAYDNTSRAAQGRVVHLFQELGYLLEEEALDTGFV